MDDSQSNNFIKKFNNGNEFYNYTSYNDGVGFSIKKDLNGESDNTSLLRFYIPDYLKKSVIKKPIIIDVAYGKKIKEGGIVLRRKNKISDPIDLISKDEYYYNVEKNKLYKNKKEILPNELINKIYNDHIKPTKFIRGIWLRTKLFFWRIIIKKFFDYLYIFLHYFLYITSGDKYSYVWVIKEEILNNKIINSEIKNMIGQKEKEEIKENLEKGKKFNFFGYMASHWTIIFYSIFHLLFYIIFEYKNWYPTIIIMILKNNFLTLIYVISSLWIMEIVIPKILKMLIRTTSRLSWNSRMKSIKI